jgi:N-acetylmuramate 1-kinase
MTGGSGPAPIGVDLDLADESATARLAEAVAAVARIGDVILLSGDLGAGKTAFARALVRAIAGTPDLEVPSPTFTLVQTYDLERLPVAHVDLYRIEAAGEVDELGLDEARSERLVLVEWPERAEGRFKGDRLEIALSLDPAMPEARRARLTGSGDWAGRLGRLAVVRDTLDRLGYGAWQRRHLQGDASTRRYERLGFEGGTAVLMDSPAMPDPGIGAVAYSRIAHLAESVMPFAAIARELKARGFSTPEILAADFDAGVLVIEDLGYQTVLDAAGRPDEARYRVAVEALAALHAMELPETATAAPGIVHRLPRYDLEAFLVETSLLLDWFAPFATGTPPSGEAAAEFRALWRDLLSGLTDPLRHRTWALRDYHSPNLMWLPEREGFARIGILDMQDGLIGPAAYDLASLVYDARVDIPEAMSRDLYAHYIAARRATGTAFDAEGFGGEFAILAAQRNTKILGIFARLFLRDGKSGYLRHLPRISNYLDLALAHPVLAGLKLWYDTHLPDELRARAADRTR